MLYTGSEEKDNNNDEGGSATKKVGSSRANVNPDLLTARALVEGWVSNMEEEVCYKQGAMGLYHAVPMKDLSEVSKSKSPLYLLLVDKHEKSAAGTKRAAGYQMMQMAPGQPQQRVAITEADTRRVREFTRALIRQVCGKFVQVKMKSDAEFFLLNERARDALVTSAGGTTTAPTGMTSSTTPYPPRLAALEQLLRSRRTKQLYEKLVTNICQEISARYPPPPQQRIHYGNTTNNKGGQQGDPAEEDAPEVVFMRKFGRMLPRQWEGAFTTAFPDDPTQGAGSLAECESQLRLHLVTLHLQQPTRYSSAVSSYSLPKLALAVALDFPSQQMDRNLMELEFLRKRLEKLDDPLGNLEHTWQDVVELWMSVLNLLHTLNVERGQHIVEAIFGGDPALTRCLQYAKLFAGFPNTYTGSAELYLPNMCDQDGPAGKRFYEKEILNRGAAAGGAVAAGGHGGGSGGGATEDTSDKSTLPKDVFEGLKQTIPTHIKLFYPKYVAAIDAEIAAITRVQELKQRAIALIGSLVLSVFVGLSNFASRWAFEAYFDQGFGGSGMS